MDNTEAQKKNDNEKEDGQKIDFDDEFGGPIYNTALAIFASLGPLAVVADRVARALQPDAIDHVLGLRQVDYADDFQHDHAMVEAVGAPDQLFTQALPRYFDIPLPLPYEPDPDNVVTTQQIRF